MERGAGERSPYFIDRDKLGRRLNRRAPGAATNKAHSILNIRGDGVSQRFGILSLNSLEGDLVLIDEVSCPDTPIGDPHKRAELQPQSLDQAVQRRTSIGGGKY